jgi:hypothetical protein
VNKAALREARVLAAICAVLGGYAALVIALIAAGCGPIEEAKRAAAEAAYTEELRDCVKQNDTREAMDACRRGVNIRWGVAETVKDAGGDR